MLKRYLEEEPLLGKLNARPRFDTDYHAVRRVGRDGRLSYRGQLYQVPLKHALSEVEVAANLDGQVTIRAKTDHTADPKSGGEVLRSERILAGKVASRQVVQGPEKEPESRQGRQESVGELLRAIYRDEPLVETRDLRVYEEVALAASVG